MPHKILLADDSITIQKVIGLTLASEEFNLTVADNGEEAYEKARADKPELIIADTNMPGMNGYELCEKIRKDPELKEVPLILLVGTYETFDAERAKKVGANDHITKPFESQQLIRKVRELLKARAVPQPAPAPTPPPAAPPQEPAPSFETAEPQTLEPLELEELEPVEVELPSAPPQPVAEAQEPEREEVAPALEIPPLEELPEEAPPPPPPAQELDFSDLSAVVSETAPSPPSPPRGGEVSWNLEEFETYLARTEGKSPEKEREAPAPPLEEPALESSFEETFTVVEPAVEEGKPVHGYEEAPPSLEPAEPEPVLPGEPELRPARKEPSPPPPPPPAEPQPVFEAAPPPPSSVPPSAAPPLPPLGELEERIRAVVSQRVEAMIEEILPRALDEAISRSLERVLNEVLERWTKKLR